MRHSITTGFSFGLTSGVITTLGLLVGLNSGTHSKLVVIGGILTIAIADAFSDALGIHISEEAEGKHTAREIWIATISTFLSKFLFAASFLIPIFFLPLYYAVFISIIYGLILIVVFSYILARVQRKNVIKVIFEHLLIFSFVIIFAHYIGDFISSRFK